MGPVSRPCAEEMEQLGSLHFVTLPQLPVAAFLYSFGRPKVYHSMPKSITRGANAPALWAVPVVLVGEDGLDQTILAQTTGTVGSCQLPVVPVV